MLRAHLRNLKLTFKVRKSTKRFNSSNSRLERNMENIKISKDSIPQGYKVASMYSGIKKDPTKLDLGLVVSNTKCLGSAVFTQNKFSAAPVQIDKQILSQNQEGIRAILVNSGCANAVTGELGLTNGWNTVNQVDQKVNEYENKPSTLVLSTGVIGHHLPMEKIQKGIDTLFTKLDNQPQSFIDLARSYMTTDTKPKLISKNVQLDDNQSYKLLGISKGAGMIHPNMATLLATVLTDCNISTELLDSALKYAVDRSFNCISIDGDTSTNDTCILLTNQLANHVLISDSNDINFIKFQKELTTIMVDLAKLIVYDAEGATKFLTLEIKNSDGLKNSRKVANSIITSTLVKTALFGNDANWGRIACAIGYSEVDIDPNQVSIKFVTEKDEKIEGVEELVLLKDGQPLPMDEDLALKFMERRYLNLQVDLGMEGKTKEADLTVWTSDLSYDYVKINAEYRS